MKFRRTSLALAVSISLSACGGGGGGGSATLGGVVQPDTPIGGTVPFYTPSKIGVVDPLVNDSMTWTVGDTYVANITGQGQDVVFAGRSSDNTVLGTVPSRLHLFSWENGTMVDKTSQWFPNNSNQIVGTEPNLHFGDFFKSGRTDIFVAPNTDTSVYGPGLVFLNNGSRFTRLELSVGNIQSHGSEIVDLDRDNYLDLVMTDYGPGFTLGINNRINNFTLYQDINGNNGDLRWGGSSVAAADFLANGQTQLVVTDNTCAASAVNCGSSTTKMYTWTIDANNHLRFQYFADLPASRFDLPKWASVMAGTSSHQVKVVAHDFNDDGIPDTIVFSRPSDVQSKFSEIQFLQNQGLGVFTDVTDSVLIGYDTRTQSTYNPKFVDINGDGRLDILVSGRDFSGENTSHQFLLKSADGKYVAAHQNILTDFVSQVNQLESTDNIGNTVNLLQGVDGKLYLVSAVSFMNGSDRQIALYISELGSAATSSAQNALNLVVQAWPYLSPAQANEALARTSTNLMGANLIDMDRLFRPYGRLGITSNNDARRREVTGILSVPGFNNKVLETVMTTDDLGRGFAANLSAAAVKAHPGSIRHSMSSQSAQNWSNRFVATNVYTTPETITGIDGPNWTTGKRYRLSADSPYSLGLSITQIQGSPWMHFDGMFGNIISSTVLESSLTHSWHTGYWVQGGMLQTSTQITPGLVTKVNPIYSVYAIGGWSSPDFRFFGGIQPTILSGSLDLSLPSDIDQQGTLQYTNHRIKIKNQVIGFAGAEKQWKHQNHLMKLGGVLDSGSRYQISFTYGYQF